jgi:NADH-quinone oxidoreductase subunit C
MSDPNADAAPEAIAPPPELLHGAPVTISNGQRVAHPAREQLATLVGSLYEDGFRQLLDVTAVDYLTHPGRTNLPEGIAPERFEVVVELLSHTARERLRLRVQVPVDDPSVPSLVGLHPGADAFEREVWDLFGIRFEGHPDLSRILMPEEWDGHPLRKDHAVGRVPVQFKGVAASR